MIHLKQNDNLVNAQNDMYKDENIKVYLTKKEDSNDNKLLFRGETTWTYTRQLTTKYSTLCIPYAADICGYKDMKICTLKGCIKNADGSLKTTILNDYEINELEPGVPYLIMLTCDVSTENPYTLTIKCKGKPVSEPKEVNGLVGVFEDFPFATWDDYQKYNDSLGVFVVKDNKLKLASSKSGVSAYRCFAIGDLIPVLS